MQLTDDQREIAEGILAFQLDDPAAAMSLTSRLCREQRWSHAYAARVGVEYKRFVVLGLFAGHPVTPSEEVDQMWHLHLLYTRSYWHDFCRETLGCEFHHGPTRGGNDEQAKFRDWYAATLASYEQIFGEAPPKDIWPDGDERFKHAGDGKWYNAATHWLIKKPFFLK